MIIVSMYSDMLYEGYSGHYVYATITYSSSAHSVLAIDLTLSTIEMIINAVVTYYTK